MEQEKPKQSQPKNFQEEVAEAILNGDLAAFKKCCVGKNDINRRLLPHKELKPKPKQNPDERYINIKGPTMLMFAILCEQYGIVEYILENKAPNVATKVEGYNCLHLAAMTKDYHSLKLLLQHKWIQEHINEPIDLPGTTQKDDQMTTALHVAVSNRRYENVFLLIDDLPQPRWFEKVDKKPAAQPAEGAGEQSGEQPPEQPAEQPANDQDEAKPANVSLKSASGSTPIYIAVFLRDYKMVKILLSLQADPSEKCAKGKSAYDLAIEIQENNANKKKRMEENNKAPKKKNSKAENDDIDLIVTALKNYIDNDQFDELDVLKKKYAPDLIENEEKSSESNSEDEDVEQEDSEDKEEAQENESKPEKESAPKGKKKPSASKQNATNEKLLRQIVQELQTLNNRISYLEKEKGFENHEPRPDAKFTKINVCSHCGASGAKLCNQCHNYYCDRCFRKPTVHNCLA